jgi:hypothetical protein
MRQIAYSPVARDLHQYGIPVEPYAQIPTIIEDPLRALIPIQAVTCPSQGIRLQSLYDNRYYTEQSREVEET